MSIELNSFSCPLSTEILPDQLSITIIMVPFSRVLFIWTILFSSIKSLKNVNSLPVSAIHDLGKGLGSTTKDRSTFTKIGSTHSALISSFQNFSDSQLTRNPNIFNNVTEYEFLMALTAEGINYTEHVVKSQFDTKFEETITPICIHRMFYFYVNCSDPDNEEIRFTNWKGIGCCANNIPSHSQNYYNFSSSSMKHKIFYGYRYIRKEKMVANCYSLHGLLLQQVVAEFVLKGKKAKYEKTISRTFQRIRNRYRGLKYFLKTELVQKNGNIYVRFLLERKHKIEPEL